MAGRAMFTGADNIMHAFDTLRPLDVPYYSVWVGPSIMYGYVGDDMDAGRAQLEDMLLAADDAGNSDLMDIKFHHKLVDGFITNKTPVIGTLRVRPHDVNSNRAHATTVNGVYRPNDIPAPVYHMMKKVDELLPALNDRLVKLETAAPVAPVEREPDTLDRIGSILDKPGVVDGILALLGPVIKSFLPGAVSGNMQVGKVSSIAENVDVGHTQTSPEAIAQNSDVISGIAENIDRVPTENNDTEMIDFTDEQNKIIDAAITDLGEFCDVVETLPLLVKFAQKFPDKFKETIGQLKMVL